jgi:hypothetical protein
MQMINIAYLVSEFLIYGVGMRTKRFIVFLAEVNRTLCLIACRGRPSSEVLVERTHADENLAIAVLHVMEGRIFTIGLIRQIVVEHQILDALLLGALSFLL